MLVYELAGYRVRPCRC